jgi:ATP-dependent RNA helicase RhlE
MPLPMQSLPSQVEIIDTEFNEKQELLREIDRQRKIDDPTFKGAFHSKKRKDNSKRNFDDKFKRTRIRQKIKKKK